ncbi:hypothetical protein K449DRAFT_436628 [Hypoxylon sp. EC38]|nr:hypothetical protein K449DRAFT_436628 [Hypoxylon sp. EC38]
MPSPSWTAAADHKACTLAGIFNSQNLAALSLGFSEDVSGGIDAVDASKLQDFQPHSTALGQNTLLGRTLKRKVVFQLSLTLLAKTLISEDPALFGLAATPQIGARMPQ